ncbi:MAG: hypothetical protein ACW99A_02400 [Candidatus Kariarchaeaceae archaeon]|jgi:hypothetical protein
MIDLEPTISRNYLKIPINGKFLKIEGIVLSSPKIDKILKSLNNNHIHNFISSTLIWSLIIQNNHFFILFIDMSPKTSKFNPSHSNRKLITKSMDKSDFRYLSGYSIFSLLFEGLYKIEKGQFVMLNDFGDHFFYKPFKIVKLEIDLHNFKKLIQILWHQRIILTFYSNMDIPGYHFTIIIRGKTQKIVDQSLQNIIGKLLETKDLRGDIQSFTERELKKKIVQASIGIHDEKLHSGDIIHYLSQLEIKQSSYKPQIRLSPDFQFQSKVASSKSKNHTGQVKKINKLFQCGIGSFPHESVEFNSLNLELFNWKTEYIKYEGDKKMVRYINKSVNIIIFPVSSINDINHKESKNLLRKGLNLLFKLNNGKPAFAKCLMIY